MDIYLIKLGELTLKGGNREDFELQLRKNIQALLKGKTASGGTAQVVMGKGRFFIRAAEELELRVTDALNRTIGLSGWAKARLCGKTPDQVLEACREEARLAWERGARSFKIEARRSDKSFPLSSYEIMRDGGSAVIDILPDFKVDVHAPDCVIEVEIRENAYVYGLSHRGVRGLPVGTSGRGLLLLSGGIDSPVAGFQMASRGMRLDAVYFHAYPYTSEEARQKVITLATLLGRYAMGIRLTTINFTDIQVRIKERSPEAWTTLLMRMAMMETADILARRSKARCLVTGESLGQVASQTIENLTCSESRAKLPVFRPLIGTDKIDTINLARKIGTYETSILPYEDCCVLFSPKHPILKANLFEATALYEKLELSELIWDAIRARKIDPCGYPGLPVPPSDRGAASAASPAE